MQGMKISVFEKSSCPLINEKSKISFFCFERGAFLNFFEYHGVPYFVEMQD
jgi:hypothetical protein